MSNIIKKLLLEIQFLQEKDDSGASISQYGGDEFEVTRWDQFFYKYFMLLHSKDKIPNQRQLINSLTDLRDTMTQYILDDYEEEERGDFLDEMEDATTEDIPSKQKLLKQEIPRDIERQRKRREQYQKTQKPKERVNISLAFNATWDDWFLEDPEESIDDLLINHVCKNDDCSYIAKFDLNEDELKNYHICAAKKLCPQVEAAGYDRDSYVTKRLKEHLFEATEKYRGQKNADKIIWDKFIKQLINLIYQLHQNAHLAHNDMHKHNVMVDEKNKVWLIDMGSSKEIYKKTQKNDKEDIKLIKKDYNYIKDYFYHISKDSPLIVFNLGEYITEYANEKNISIEKAEGVIVNKVRQLPYDQMIKMRVSRDSKGKMVIPKELTNAAVQEKKQKQMSGGSSKGKQKQIGSPRRRQQKRSQSPRRQQQKRGSPSRRSQSPRRQQQKRGSPSRRSQSPRRQN